MESPSDDGKDIYEQLRTAANGYKMPRRALLQEIKTQQPTNRWRQ